MRITDKIKIKILQKEISTLRKRVDNLTKENNMLKSNQDKVDEITLTYLEKIKLAEDSKNDYDKITREMLSMMSKYKKEFKKVLK